MTAALILTAGCFDSDELETDQEVAAVETENGMSWNGMSWNGMSMNGLTTNGMSWNGMSWNGVDPKDVFDYLQGRSILETLLTEPLDSNGLLVNALAGTVEGSQLLAYSVKCGFAQGHDFHPGPWKDPAPGVLGLFDEWESRALNDREIELWFGCMLAHVNALGVSVPISVVGRQETIESPDKGYDVLEGSFFGSFGDFGGEGISEDLYACYGGGVLTACGSDSASVAYMNRRFCTLYPGACGNLTIVGQCNTYNPSLPAACQSYDGLSHADCAGNSGYLYEKTVITVRLEDPVVCDP